MAAPTSPIADLSYRNYDGPLESPRFRWWVIAKMTIRQALKKKSLWVAMAFSGWYYLAMIFVLFVMDNLAQQLQETGRGGPAIDFLGRIVWKDQFLHGFSFGQLLFLIIALVLGSGSIANDNRANALLVYLSKPVTKLDYLFGKWFGVFLPLLLVMLVPSLVFWLYGAMSYREYGFFFQDAWVLPKLLILLPISAAFHASLVVGISSLFNQGRIAGATYAGFYFLSNFFTILMRVAWHEMQEDRGTARQTPQAVLDTIGRLFYASVDGANIGLAKAILGTDGGAPFGFPMQRSTPVPAPSLLGVTAIVVGLSVLSLLIAWKRIRAVEIVG